MYSAVLLPLVLLPFSFAAKISVDVGKGSKLVFDPKNITAAKGDTIEFNFYPQNHSVAQSTFDKPCVASDNGIFSGFIPSTNGEAKQIFTVTVNDNNPIWFYCSQGRHCQSGMAMVVNQPKDNTLDAYLSKAVTVADSSSQPKVEGGVVSDKSSGSSASSSMATAASTASAASGSTATSTATKSGTSSTASSKPNAVGKVSAGAGLGALGLLGVLVGGMV